MAVLLHLRTLLRAPVATIWQDMHVQAEQARVLLDLEEVRNS